MLYNFKGNIFANEMDVFLKVFTTYLLLGNDEEFFFF